MNSILAREKGLITIFVFIFIFYFVSGGIMYYDKSALGP